MIMRRNELREENLQNQDEMDEDSRSEASSFANQKNESFPKVEIFRKYGLLEITISTPLSASTLARQL